jgi:RNA-directed DNA polymerase
VATIRDRVVQASLKLVLEPVFEADFLSCSYGFRPNRRAHDAVAEIHHFTSRSYEWIVEGDIKACFDEISHSALMDRVRKRVGDKRVLALVKAFLKAGILDEGGDLNDTNAGTPQGSIASPILSNIYLDRLDQFVETQLLPLHNRGKRRTANPAYERVRAAMRNAERRGDRAAAKALRRQLRTLPSVDPRDPGYRRLRYVRYADDSVPRTLMEVAM